jgi:transcriptional regulator GlxA family with amidase domain
MNRRELGELLVASAMVGAAGSVAAADEKTSPQASGDRFPPMHQGRKPDIAMLIYPGLTLLDMLGPQAVLAGACNVHLVWKNTDALESDTGVVIHPSTSFDACPADLDAIFVGGGPGQLAVMTDPAVLRFLADRGSRAKWVTSVCSGSLVLGAAGLLKGYQATSHWACHKAPCSAPRRSRPAS